MTPGKQRADRLGRQLTLLVSSSIKLGGLYLIFKSAAAPPIDPLVLAEAAFMMSGAQVSEGTILRMIDRFFTGEAPPPEQTLTIKHESSPAPPVPPTEGPTE